MSSGTQFNITQYGQDRMVMDWFGLQDPFDQFLPIKITNTWSGDLYFNYNLSGQPAWYSNVSGSLSGVLAGSVPLAAGTANAYAIRWSVSISGQIDKSGPNTDTLNIYITAYTSGFLSGTLASGLVTTKNVLFNRYSGVIKVFGDQYSANVPNISLTQAGVGTLVAGGSYTYALSYFLSGWESDVGAPSAGGTPSSGALALSWNGVAGVTQYAVWRWSGSADFSLYQGSTLSGTMDLIALISGTSMTDSGITALQTGLYRHRIWQTGSFTGGTFLSPPDAIAIAANNTFYHTWQINKNLSGVTLLGPLYLIWHTKQATPRPIVLNQTFTDNTIGQTLADTVALGRIVAGNWNRFGIYLSGGSLTATHSGKAVNQIDMNIGLGNSNYIDDVFLVANS